MSLAAGTKLGPYEIRGAAGAGGMGEVYRAHDSRLGRDVAIKVLPAHLKANPDLRQRFEREARAVSSLNHPNICVLHDIGREDDVDYLVMEYLEGETLAARLASGPLEPAEVLRYGVQIADALDKAHRSGVVHRDLKPGNVMLTKSGAKLMDFGLARAAGPSGAAVSDSSQSPTLTQPLTAEGSIVGTFQYMAPEQLEGREADTRSDIFGLGATLYEMATGHKAFEGKSQASLIASIMKEQPRPIGDVSPLTPPGLDRVVRQCLAKDPDDRLQSAHDVKLQLQWVAEGGSQAGVPAPVSARRKTRENVAWAVAAVFALATLALGIARITQAPKPAQATRVTVIAPDEVVLDDEPEHITVSPDGRSIAFMASDSTGVWRIWVRALDSETARMLPSTEGATIPFWSPDSRSIAFFANGKLKKIPIDGNNSQVLCDAPDGRGGAWSKDGSILFAPSSEGPLYRVSASGGEPVQATVLDTTTHEGAHRFPSFLPDGKHFLYGVAGPGNKNPTKLGTLGSDKSIQVIVADGVALYSPPGYIVFPLNGTLLAQGFDAGRGVVRGEPLAIGLAPASWGRYAVGTVASVSANGVLVQRHDNSQRTRIEWLDRQGRAAGSVPAPPGEYSAPVFSPDGSHVAILVASPDNVNDIWVIDPSQGLPNRLTFDAFSPANPVWSPDDSQIYYGAWTGESTDIFRKPSNGAGEAEQVLDLDSPFNGPRAISPDGRYMVYRSLSPETGEDVWAMSLADGKIFPCANSRYHEEDASLSPDGRWLAFCSNESGRTELYVQSFPEARAKRRISTAGAGTGVHSAGRPLWRRDGRELFFWGGDGVTMMAVPIEPGTTIRPGTPHALFKLPPDCIDAVPSPDGQRFLVLREVKANDRQAIHVTLNWPALLKE